MRERERLDAWVMSDDKKYTFPHRRTVILNGMEEEWIAAKGVHYLKKRQDKYRHENRALRA